jgi:hypothetical protein
MTFSFFQPFFLLHLGLLVKQAVSNPQKEHQSYHFFGSHTIPKRFNPFAAQDPKNHHERVKKVVEVPSGNGVGVECLRCVVLSKQLHANDGENINNDD